MNNFSLAFRALPALLGILLACGSAYAQTKGVRILSSDQSGITIEVRPNVTKQTVVLGDRTYTQFSVEGSARTSAERPGAPDLPIIRELLALPGVTGNTLMVQQTDYAEEQAVEIAPIPRFIPTKDSGEIEYRYVAGTEYQTPGLFPSVAAELINVGVARDRVLGSLVIHPVQYDPLAKKARIVNRLVIRIDFGPRYPGLTTLTAPSKEDFSWVLNGAQAASWRISHPAALRKSAGATLENGTWLRIPIEAPGVYKLTKSWFAESGVDVSGIDPRTIRLFGNGGRELSTATDSVFMSGFTEIAIEVVGEQDGRFDDNDYVLFYGQGLTGFSYNASTRRYRHYIHRFAAANSYMLTFGSGTGKRMPSLASLNDANPARPQWFTGRDFIEEEAINMLSSGKLWVGPRMTPGAGESGDSRSYAVKLNGRVPDQPLRYAMQLYSRAGSGTTNSFSISDNGVSLGTIQMSDVELGSFYVDQAASSGIREYSANINPPDNRSVVTVVYRASNPEKNEGGFCDWIEWFYPRSFIAFDDVLAFPSPDTSAVIEYTVTGFSMSDVVLYDVRDFADVKRISNAFVSGGTARFQAFVEQGNPREYYCAAMPGVKTPAAGAKVENSLLRGTDGAELIIITESDFVPAANTLKAHKERLPGDPTPTVVASLSAIYNEFNAGVPDPTAIRNFLGWAFLNWRVRPQQVLLLGDGHYDYKHIIAKERMIVPTWQSENSVTPLGTYPTDDYYVTLVGKGDFGQPDKRVDMGIGRLTVQTVDEAAAAINKIITYESKSDFGVWRNRVTLVADDHLTNSGFEGSGHTDDSEDLAATLPPAMEAKKIYTVSYPTELTAQGRRKPEAARAIINQINEGTIMMNYIGHGSEKVWAHEQVLFAETAIPQMTNLHRLSFITAATCTFGLYDAPSLRSGTELFLMKPDGGAIGVLSSPRLVLITDNDAYSRSFFSSMFRDGREPDGRPKRLGDINFAVKQVLFGNEGYERFHLFADPSVRLVLPRHRVVLQAVKMNGQPLPDTLAQIKALSKVTLEGAVTDYAGNIFEDFSGVAQIMFLDADRVVPVPEWNGSYKTAGGLLYRGQSTISNGRFISSFIVPKDISYENNFAKLSLYYDNNETDGAGYNSKIRIGGSDTSAISDNKGPEIQLFMDGRAFRSGDMVNENSTLIADLYDENGINTTGLGVGHNIESWLNNAGKSIILNEYFKGELDSYQKGSVEYKYQDLPQGRNAMRLKAWDIVNNSSVAEIEFTVAPSASLRLTEVLPFPNPMTEKTMFTFVHNQSQPVDAEVKVYTLAGRMVKRLERRGVGDRFVRVEWDGRDEDGDRLANGVYLYKVIVKTIDGGKGSEAMGKLSVLR